MVLSAGTIALIRDEIGNDLDFSDADPASGLQLDSLENIYNDANRGNTNVLRTALICWRRRLFNLQERSFDVVTEGALLSRNQRIRFMERKIKNLEMLTDTTQKGKNMTVLSSVQVEAAVDAGSEFA